MGTFTSSIGLWDRVKDRRRQNRRDTTQDDEIKKLKAQVEASTAAIREQSSRREARDEVGDSFQRSGALIRREFDNGYERYGRDFAVGDVITENKLQAQLIALQQTVINVLQDALYSGRPLGRADMEKLVRASETAREGSVDALRGQQRRLLGGPDEPRSPQQLALPPPVPQLAIGPPMSHGSTSSKASRRSEMSRKSGGSRESAPTTPLYCGYSLDLQYGTQPLSKKFAPGGSCKCPACGMRLVLESDDVWAIGKRTKRRVPDRGGHLREVVEETEFLISPRFLVKSHTPEGEFACLLCTQYADGDVVCPSVDVLVNHIGKHDIAELEKEPDFRVRVLEPVMT